MDPSPPHDTGANTSDLNEHGLTAIPRPETKLQLRKRFRELRREHVLALPQSMRALLFLRPPVPVATRIPDHATVGLYHPHPYEAPTLSYARWLHENGRRVALPCFADRTAPMTFHLWADPYDEDSLEVGPFGVLQPTGGTEPVAPEVLLVPLLAFTAEGVRLGQGGGHYDRWLAAHPDTLAIGLAWDIQLAERLPREAHDRALAMVVTPTRLYEGAQ